MTEPAPHSASSPPGKPWQRDYQPLPFINYGASPELAAALNATGGVGEYLAFLGRQPGTSWKEYLPKLRQTPESDPQAATPATPPATPQAPQQSPGLPTVPGAYQRAKPAVRPPRRGPQTSR